APEQALQGGSGNADSFTYLFPMNFLSKRRCRASLIHARLFNVLCPLSGEIVDIIVTRMGQLIQTSLAGRLR
ncbi:hypothetical protein N4Q71_22195, partial [Salmonella enterica subsp. enterica serovar Montevideo]